MAYNNRQEPCDTYFVESEDFQAPLSQEYIKMLSRRREQAQADLLSKQAYELYVEDIVAHMKQMEVNSPASVLSFPLLTLCRKRPSPMLLPSTSSRRSSGS